MGQILLCLLLVKDLILIYKLLKESGEVFSWGCNDSGQLGYKSGSSNYTPQQIMTKNNRIIEIEAGFNHSFIISGIFILFHLFLFLNK